MVKAIIAGEQENMNKSKIAAKQLDAAGDKFVDDSVAHVKLALASGVPLGREWGDKFVNDSKAQLHRLRAMGMTSKQVLATFYRVKTEIEKLVC